MTNNCQPIHYVYIDPAEAINLLKNQVTWIDRFLEIYSREIDIADSLEQERFDKELAEYEKKDNGDIYTYKLYPKYPRKFRVDLPYIQHHSQANIAKLAMVKSLYAIHPVEHNALTALKVGVWYSAQRAKLGIADQSDTDLLRTYGSALL